MYGIVNFNVIDTTPGADNAFSPPSDFKDGDYRRLMIERLSSDLGVKQHVFIVARKLALPLDQQPIFLGEYAQLARNLCEVVLRRSKTTKVVTNGI